MLLQQHPQSALWGKDDAAADVIAPPLLQVLRFWGYFVDPVPGSTDEPWRLRKCALCFFLEVRSCLWRSAGRAGASSSAHGIQQPC